MYYSNIDLKSQLTYKSSRQNIGKNLYDKDMGLRPKPRQ